MSVPFPTTSMSVAADSGGTAPATGAATPEEKPEPTLERSLRAVTLCAVAMFIAIEAWGSFLPLTYDEPWYIGAVELVDRHGFATPEFLTSLPGPTGPLHTWVHWLCRPLTGLAPPVVRFVNPLLVACTLAAVAATVRVTRGRAPWVSALLLTAVPMAWPCTGMALTEVPALAFYALHVWLLFRGWSAPHGGWREVGIAIVSGVALGLAILGRQPLLLTAGAVIFCGCLDRRHLGTALLCVAAALAVCGPVFFVWHGLVPPSKAGADAAASVAHTVVAGLVPMFAAYALAYAGIVLGFVAPGILGFRPRLWGAVIAGSVALSILLRLGDAESMPLDTVMRMVLPPSTLWIAGSAFHGALLGVAACVGVALPLAAWQRRHDVVSVFCILALLSQVVAAAAVRHQFSSRYLFAVTPVVLLLSSRLPPVRTAPLRAGLGAVVGFLSLAGYFIIAARH